MPPSSCAVLPPSCLRGTPRPTRDLEGDVSTRGVGGQALPITEPRPVRSSRRGRTSSATGPRVRIGSVASSSALITVLPRPGRGTLTRHFIARVPRRMQAPREGLPAGVRIWSSRGRVRPWPPPHPGSIDGPPLHLRRSWTRACGSRAPQLREFLRSASLSARWPHGLGPCGECPLHSREAMRRPRLRGPRPPPAAGTRSDDLTAAGRFAPLAPSTVILHLCRDPQQRSMPAICRWPSIRCLIMSPSLRCFGC